MLKETKTQVISGLIVAGIISLVQWVFHYPIFENIWWFIKLIWNNVFRFELELWLVITIILLRLLILKIIRTVRGKVQTTQQPEFKNYTRDTIGSCDWTWDYDYDEVQKHDVVTNLKPVCPKCDTPANYEYDNLMYIGYILECPRCDTKISVKTKEKVEAIIIDNIKRNDY